MANEARMYKTCEDNPSLPGCPYTPPLQFDLTGVDPDEGTFRVQSACSCVGFDRAASVPPVRQRDGINAH